MKDEFEESNRQQGGEDDVVDEDELLILWRMIDLIGVCISDFFSSIL
jgi:hypothetical protein